MGTKVYDNALDLITFSRASGGTYLGSDGLLKTASTNVPRIEYAADGTVKGLLIEEARTNLFTYSEDFTNAAWNKVNTTLTSVVSPTGQTDGTLAEPTTNANGIIEAATIVADSTNTASIYLKYAEAQWARILVYDTTASVNRITLWVDILNGVLGSATNGGTGTGATGQIEALPNGWYRVSLSGAVNNGTTSVSFQVSNAAANASVIGTLDNYELYGAQLEAGSFPTSYIPTAGATATRAADIASIPVSAFGYNQKAGSVVVEWNSDDATAHIANFYTDASNRWVILKDAGNQKSFVSDGGTAVMNSVIASAPSGDNKSAMSISLNSGNGVINGGTVVSDTSVSVPVVSNLAIGKDEASNYYLNGHIKSIAYYPRRLTNIQLQELTA